MCFVVPTSLNLKSKDDLNKQVPERNEEDRDEVDHNYMNIGAKGLSPTEELREYINYSHAAANSSRCSSWSEWTWTRFRANLDTYKRYIIFIATFFCMFVFIL